MAMEHDQWEAQVKAVSKKEELTGEDLTEQLRKEIMEARQEWMNANRFFDYAVGSDQVDYAIYAIISAEKRYEMLLRIAKQNNHVWPKWKAVME